jgi:hypothetical protein
LYSQNMEQATNLIRTAKLRANINCYTLHMEQLSYKIRKKGTQN